MNDYRIIWTNHALLQVEKIGFYIKKDSPVAALKLMEQLLDRPKQLLTFPKSGMIEICLNLSNTEYRYLLHKKYKIIYHLSGKTIFIDTVFHTRRNPNDLIKEIYRQ